MRPSRKEIIVTLQRNIELEVRTGSPTMLGIDRAADAIVKLFDELYAENKQLRSDCEWADTNRQQNLVWAKAAEARAKAAETERAIAKLRIFGMSSALRTMGDALDVADRLITNGYGVETPQAWHDVFPSVVAALSSALLATNPSDIGEICPDCRGNGCAACGGAGAIYDTIPPVAEDMRPTEQQVRTAIAEILARPVLDPKEVCN
jgi:hypothetical protein